jgi:hypothetical protein
MDASAAEEDHPDEGLVRVKPIRPTGDHPDLGVEAFDETVGQPSSDVGQDAGQVLADRAGRLDEGRKLRA